MKHQSARARRLALQHERWRREKRRREKRRAVRARKGQARHAVARRSLPQRRVTVRVSAPAVFSLIKNPNGSLRFLAALAAAFRAGHSAYVDMSGVKELTSDAVVVLLSKLHDDAFTFGNVIGGNEPRELGPKNLLEQSGFFDFVRSQKLREASEDGRIRRRISNLVEPLVADDLVGFATERMKGRKEDRHAVFETLIDCMGNTHEHADVNQLARHSWFANVYCPKNGQRAYFTIVDNGVGIFKSVRVWALRRRLRELLGISQNPALFREWIEGRIDIPSRTRQRRRGKGIRRIHSRAAACRNGMTNLIIIANDVYANFAQDRYEELSVPFNGTMVYWEVEP